jgi:hypothetical protein
MIKEKKEKVVKDVKEYVGGQTIKGIGKLSPFVLKGIGYAVGTIFSALFAYKAVRALRKS